MPVGLRNSAIEVAGWFEPICLSPIRNIVHGVIGISRTQATQVEDQSLLRRADQHVGPERRLRFVT